MNPGEVVDAELTRVGRATGLLATMWVKRRIVRSTLEEVVARLEEASRRLRALLGREA